MNEQPSQTENDKFNKILSLVRCELETVRQEKLVEFLASKPNFARAVMIRKGREIMRKDLVGIEEGPNGFFNRHFPPCFRCYPIKAMHCRQGRFVVQWRRQLSTQMWRYWSLHSRLSKEK